MRSLAGRLLPLHGGGAVIATFKCVTQPEGGAS